MGRSLAILGLATPNFWLATMVIVFPAIWWRWSPPLVLVSFADDPLGSLAGFAIPSLILGTYLSAATMRVTRTMMLEVLSQDYIRTAWSKGLLERSVILRHAVKNALIPVDFFDSAGLAWFQRLPYTRGVVGGDPAEDQSPSIRVFQTRGWSEHHPSHRCAGS